MTHSTLLTLLLTTPFAASSLPPAQRPLPHLQQITQLLEDCRAQPVTPAATRAFELRLQELLRRVGLDLGRDQELAPLGQGPDPARWIPGSIRRPDGLAGHGCCRRAAHAPLV